MEDTIVLTGYQIEGARWLTVRAMLSIRIKTGLKHSRASELKLANGITGKNDRTLKAAHASLNAKIVEAFGPDFDKPLPAFAPGPTVPLPASTDEFGRVTEWTGANPQRMTPAQVKPF